MKSLSIGSCRLAGLLLAALFAVSCSTSSGSSYSSSVSTEAQAAQAAKARSAQASSGSGGSSSSSSGHSSSGGVYYNPGHSSSAGSSLFFDLLVTAAQYATSGTLVVPGLAPGLVLTVDGTAYAPGSILLPQGPHTVRVAGFGYMPWETSIIVVMGQTQNLSPDLTPAPFSLGSVRTYPAIFDPTAPGRLGRARISFHASAPGTARVEILDREGRRVFESPEVELLGPEGQVFWEGLSRKGRSLEPGDYRVLVKATSAGGQDFVATGSLTLAETRASTTASTMAGFSSGAMYAPDARTLPLGHLELSMGGYAVLDTSVAGAARLPLFGGIRLGLPLKSELAISGLNVGYAGYSFGDVANWAGVSASLKTQVAGDDITALSLILGGSWGSYFSSDAAPSWDGPSRFPGYSAGLVVEYDSSIARLFASIQGEASNYYPGWTDINTVPGFYTWAYLRGGVDLLLPDLLGSEGDLALSVASRTSPFTQGLSFTTPLSIGAELHWYLPKSSTVLTVLASGEWNGKRDWYLGGGLGLGFLF